MAVLNVHERTLSGSAAEIGALIDSLAGPDDRLWPHAIWPAMLFDRPLGAGAVGGHGPIRYTVDTYIPGTWLRCTFTGPPGINGFHEFTVHDNGDTTTLRHTMALRLTGRGRLTWPLGFRWMHDALLEDAMDCAEQAVTGAIRKPNRWSIGVRLLRWGMKRTGRSAAPSNA